MRYLPLLALLLALAGLLPRVTDRAVAMVSATASALTRRAWVAGALAAVLPMAIRLVLLPWWPIPTPRIPDEFSYLYAADTFASGRVVNPGHPLWQFFEAPYIVVHSAMYSKYPPAQGMMLAVGQLLFGDPWFGAWLSSGILCAACYWLFLAMAPRNWALLGALLPACYLALSSYWMNSYWGGNAAAAAGAVMLGSFLRLRRRPAPVWAAAFAGAWTILAASRPYEGAVLFAVPLAAVLIFGKRRWPQPVWVAGAAVGVMGGLLLGGYNMAVTGQPWKLPYQVYYEQYSYVPALAFLPLRPKPTVRQEILRTTMEYDERRYRTMNSPGRFEWLAGEWRNVFTICLPTILFLPLCILGVPLVRQRRTRWLAALLGFGILGISVGSFHFAHYFAPFVPLLFLLAVLGLRQLRGDVWRRAVLVTLLAGAAGQCVLAVIREIRTPPQPHSIALRPAIEAFLQEGFEDHLVFVNDSKFSDFRPSWVYNRASLDKARIIWAVDFGEEENAKLIRTYPGRRVWLLPIEPPLTLKPYGAAHPLQEPVRFQ